MIEIPGNVCHVVVKLINISNVIMFPNPMKTLMKPTLYPCVSRSWDGQ